ncbi:aryl-sulfate sulfotransferase [bacterium]|nr:aryl-sulfate sulfotransferase [bacterium]
MKCRYPIEMTIFLVVWIIPAMAFCLELPKNVIYLHPKPDAADICYKTGVICRIDPALQGQFSLNDFTITVAGDNSGHQQGRMVLSNNNVLFQLDNAYDPGEEVEVTIQCEKLGWAGPYTYRFSVNPLTDYFLYKQGAQSATTDSSDFSKTAAGEMTTINGVTVPGDFPIFKPEIKTSDISPGKIFITNWSGTPYIMIFENNGTPYFFKRLIGVTRDFKIQPNGELSRHENGRFAVMDSSCDVKRYVQCGHGYLTDEHELLILPDGHYFMIAVGNREMDMSKIVANGNKNAKVKDTHIQEFDEYGNIIFEWLCFEYLNIEHALNVDFTASKIDYVHMNSVAIDYDDHILISNRHLNEVTKINRQTGDIIWRLGGVSNEFKFTNDKYQISYQHDARPVPGKPDHYTVFDNGNHHNPQFSRAVEFSLDTEQMTATRIWEYRLPSGHAHWMGNAQRLPNGHTHINWADGSVPKVTEVTPDGRVVYQADFINPDHSYRTFRFEWEHAVDKPYLLVENMPYHVNLIFNKFGDKTVKEYKIYTGKIGRSLKQIASTTHTFYQFTQNDLENNTMYAFRVRAVHENGKTSEGSNQETLLVKFIGPGEELVENGDFSDRYQSWTWDVTGGAKASRLIDSEKQFKFRITDGGSEYYHIQVTQKAIPLMQGLSYVFEFDAYADATRPFDAKLTKDGDPYTNYGKIGPTALTKRKKHFKYEFVMQDATDTQARVVLNAGTHAADVYVDNVSLKMSEKSIAEPDKRSRPDSFELYQNFPNPFNPATTVEYAVSEQVNVKIAVYNISGAQVRQLINGDHSPGCYQVTYDGTNSSTGIYLCNMLVTTRQGKSFQKVFKMMLIK